MVVYGYIRVSTHKGQTTENQRKEILDAGYAVDDFFSEDGISGKIPQKDRPAFKELMGVVKEGDVVIVSKMDRLGRTASDTLNTIDTFKKLGVKVVVLQFGGLDMNSTAGKFMKSILAAVAEMEYDLNRERIMSGLARTKAAGTIIGPPLKMSPATLKDVCTRYADGKGESLGSLSKEYGVHKSMLSRNISKWKNDLSGYENEYSTKVSQYAKKESGL